MSASLFKLRKNVIQVLYLINSLFCTIPFMKLLIIYIMIEYLYKYLSYGTFFNTHSKTTSFHETFIIQILKYLFHENTF